MQGRSLALGIALVLSLLLNVVAFVRLRDRDHDEPRRAAQARSTTAPDETPAPARTATVVVESPTPAPAHRDPAAAPVPGNALTPRPSGPAPVALPAVRNDPKVLEVLEAQDSFSAFWRDLDRVFKARARLDEPKYFQTVMAATGDYLELPENARTQFGEAARTAAAGMANARKEYDAARKALPPKDKTNAATYAVYQQQKDAVDARYQEQIKGAVDSLKLSLDPKRPRHAEFASGAEKWLRNLAPKPQQP